MKIDKSCFEQVYGCETLKHKEKIRIVRIVFITIQELKTQQPELFDKRLSEETLKYQFLRMFEMNFNREMNVTDDYIDYKEDVNYNRTGNDMKYVGVEIGDNGRTLFDLVIHQRGIGNRKYPENLIHFEFKGFNDNQHAIKADKKRLTFTTMGNIDPLIVPNGYIQIEDSKYIRGYQLGLFLHFSKNDVNSVFAYSNGKKLNNTYSDRRY
ncbi:MAG TPA: hypothetical protein PLJ98_06810 [Acholeplasmataceae bacterium]|nr:hypothetical protein [Acholeplasmataceae bacterium]